MLARSGEHDGSLKYDAKDRERTSELNEEKFQWSIEEKDKDVERKGIKERGQLQKKTVN